MRKPSTVAMIATIGLAALVSACGKPAAVQPEPQIADPAVANEATPPVEGEAAIGPAADAAIPEEGSAPAEPAAPETPTAEGDLPVTNEAPGV